MSHPTFLSQTTQWSLSTILLVVSLSLPASLRGAQDNEASKSGTLGISKTQPDSGPFVKLADDAFMVPYSHSVEGTEVSFEMIPIPGGKATIGSPDEQPGRSQDEGPVGQAEEKSQAHPRQKTVSIRPEKRKAEGQDTAQLVHWKYSKWGGVGVKPTKCDPVSGLFQLFPGSM